jgi:ABC-type glycerol-3-phosphate transport system permease component
MSAVQPIELPIDESTKDQLAKGERGIEAASRRTKKRLTSRGATIAAVVIAVLWTIPTFGLFVSSFRPEQQVKTTGWWTIFSDFQVTIDNYVQVLQAGNSTLNLAGSWVNSIAIAALKVYDIVAVMTGGRANTSVLGFEMVNQQQRFQSYGHSAALAVVLFLFVLPLIVYNANQIKKQREIR